jgi:hypothetical protein
MVHLLSPYNVNVKYTYHVPFSRLVWKWPQRIPTNFSSFPSSSGICVKFVLSSFSHWTPVINRTASGNFPSWKENEEQYRTEFILLLSTLWHCIVYHMKTVAVMFPWNINLQDWTMSQHTIIKINLMSELQVISRSICSKPLIICCRHFIMTFQTMKHLR